MKAPRDVGNWFHDRSYTGPPVLDIPKRRINPAYAFDNEHWPDLNDPAYQARLGLYLGQVTQNNPAPTRPNSDAAPTGRQDMDGGG